MIVRKLQNAAYENRLVESQGWESSCLLSHSDKAGFSFHIVRVFADTELHLHFQQHLKSVYCIRGIGEIEDIEKGVMYPLSPGTLYLLKEHDRHVLRAIEELELACVCNPPLFGQETSMFGQEKSRFEQERLGVSAE